MKRNLVFLMMTAFAVASIGSTRAENPPTRERGRSVALMKCLTEELQYSMDNLSSPDGVRPYYINYSVYDEAQATVSASLGAVNQNDSTRERYAVIDVRVGDYRLDNTHQLRGAGPAFAGGSDPVSLPLADESDAILHALWYHTDRAFKQAVSRLAKIKTNLTVKVEEEDQSDDFTREEPQAFEEPPVKLAFDSASWAQRLRKVSAVARDFPLIYNSSIAVGAYAGTRSIVSSEGTRLQTTQVRSRVTLTASTKAEDGMILTQSADFSAFLPEKLPSDEPIEEAFRRIIQQVLALRDAPLAEPYIGPAILRNRASAVFFHEIFGHRIEGHRQKDVTEGQTFTKKINERVLPEFISVYDDPTLDRFADIELRGHYLYDDEGVKSTNVPLVENGVLKTFLMSRRPVQGFPRSNGHGRRQGGAAPVSRQANLIVRSARQMPFSDLRSALLEECKRQNKPYGLLFEDISGGFTTTSRRGPQSFKVLPLVVYRVYEDGRADELIRGVDIVGTPLTSFEKIIATGDDPAVFNGSCGAESGWVPVSAVSPSILVSTIEIEKRQRDQSRPPILDPPGLDGDERNQRASIGAAEGNK